jgi:Predicted restriction endonuclease
VITCIECSSVTTLVRGNGKVQWYNYKDGKICHNCYNKLHSEKWRKPTLRFKNQRIRLNENPRKGICQWCGYQGYTHMHHAEYHDDDPLKDTIELCARCHKGLHWVKI